MTRFVVSVYKGSSYYPDREMQSLSRGRADRHIEQLRAEGFEPRLSEKARTLTNSGSDNRTPRSLR